MKKKLILGLASASLVLAMSMTAFAGEWKGDSNGWWYDNGNGSYPKATWQWIDGNGDGIAESYYFESDGYLAVDTSVDGYDVNSDGQWVVVLIPVRALLQVQLVLMEVLFLPSRVLRKV